VPTDRNTIQFSAIPIGFDLQWRLH